MVFWITQKKITRNSLAVHARSMSGLVRYAIVDASVRCLLCWPSSHLVQTNPEKSLPAFSSLVIADRARSRVSEKLLQLRILDLRNLQLLRIRHVYAAVFRTAAESDTHGANALPDPHLRRLYRSGGPSGPPFSFVQRLVPGQKQTRYRHLNNFCFSAESGPSALKTIPPDSGRKRSLCRTTAF